MPERSCAVARLARSLGGARIARAPGGERFSSACVAYTRAVAAPKLRPTFELSAEVPPREVVARIKANLETVKDSIVPIFTPSTTMELVPHPSLVVWNGVEC